MEGQDSTEVVDEMVEETAVDVRLDTIDEKGESAWKCKGHPSWCSGRAVVASGQGL